MKPLTASLVLLSSSLVWAQASVEANLDGLEIEVLDQRGDRALLGAHARPAPDTSPEGFSQKLFERSASGPLLPLADDVSVAAYAPDGAILYVQGDALLELVSGVPVVIARPVLGDFAIDPFGRRIAVVRPDAEPDAWIELIDRSGRHVAVLSEPSGANAWPVFSPDGTAVYFVSGRTGVFSWFRVGADGAGLEQLTNVGLQPGGDVLGGAFVPPPASKASIRFLDASRLEYDAGDGFWTLDLATREAHPNDGVRR